MNYYSKLKKNLKKSLSGDRKIRLKILGLVLAAVFIVIPAIRGGMFILESMAVTEVYDSLGYPVRGADVSHYQGEIDWKVLAKQDLSFVFIKATEGASAVDSRFEYNWEESGRTHLKTGAYHFFSFDSSAADQAENFISTVPERSGMMPPVIDVELYGRYIDSPPSAEQVEPVLTELIKKIEDHYGMTPIIYCNTYSYNHYIRDRYDNPIWFANPSVPETLPDGRQWDFIQYTFEGELDGYSGGVKHIDLNAFYGTKEQFITMY